MINFSSILNRFGFGWANKDTNYNTDSSKPTPESIKKLLRRNVASDIVMPKITGRTQDEKVLSCLRYVINNIKYTTDNDLFGKTELWQDAVSTLKNKKGDCEDGAILLFTLLRKNRVNPLQIRLVARYVELDGKLVGHCYVQYRPDEFIDTWYTLDWCYWADTRKFSDRLPSSDKYKNIWFAVTDI